MSRISEIIVADDDKTVRTVILNALNKHGYSVGGATSAASMWDIVTSGKGKLLITDGSNATWSSDTVNVENKTEMVEEELIQGETESQEDFISRCCVYCRTKDKANQIDKDSENEGEGGDDGGNNGYLVSGMNSESILHSDGIWLHALMYAGGIQGKETESSSNNNDDDSHTWGPFESAMPNWSWSFLKLEEGPKQNQK